MNQITHEKDDDGHMRQIVSAETLRQILAKDGDTLAKPKWFGPDDERDVGDDDAAPIGAETLGAWKRAAAGEPP